MLEEMLLTTHPVSTGQANNAHVMCKRKTLGKGETFAKNISIAVLTVIAPSQEGMAAGFAMVPSRGEGSCLHTLTDFTVVR